MIRMFEKRECTLEIISMPHFFTPPVPRGIHVIQLVSIWGDSVIRHAFQLDLCSCGSCHSWTAILLYSSGVCIQSVIRLTWPMDVHVHRVLLICSYVWDTRVGLYAISIIIIISNTAIQFARYHVCIFKHTSTHSTSNKAWTWWYCGRPSVRGNNYSNAFEMQLN